MDDWSWMQDLTSEELDQVSKRYYAGNFVRFAIPRMSELTHVWQHSGVTVNVTLREPNNAAGHTTSPVSVPLVGPRRPRRLLVLRHRCR